MAEQVRAQDWEHQAMALPVYVCLLSILDTVLACRGVHTSAISADIADAVAVDIAATTDTTLPVAESSTIHITLSIVLHLVAASGWLHAEA